MPRVPQWREQPEPVWVICQQVSESTHPDEVVVQFKNNGDEYTAFVPRKFVDIENRRLQAFIVADYDDSWLVDIPAETLTSGSRIRIHNPEKASVIIKAA